MNVPFSLLLAAERAIHPGTVAAGKQAYPDIARKSVGPLAAPLLSLPSRVLDETPKVSLWPLWSHQRPPGGLLRHGIDIS
jgi:hypothetical protein